MTMEIENFEPLTYAEKKAYREGRRAGRREGRRDGVREARRESARRMQRLGLDLATIAQVLGVSESDARALLGGAESQA